MQGPIPKGAPSKKRMLAELASEFQKEQKARDERRVRPIYTSFTMALCNPEKTLRCRLQWSESESARRKGRGRG